MHKDIVIFNDEDDFMELTGQSWEELFERGFIMDDITMGFQIKLPFDKEAIEGGLVRILDRDYWSYHYVEYDGYAYFSVHH
ncbi:MAG: hypothetical protein LUD50_03525 [Clostridia bacterium]|nr:hypothetical protein [Clostridia bacterium]